MSSSDIATRFEQVIHQNEELRIIELGKFIYILAWGRRWFDAVVYLGSGSGLVSLVLASLLQVLRKGKETSLIATDLGTFF